jgi:hypothetical protein
MINPPENKESDTVYLEQYSKKKSSILKSLLITACLGVSVSPPCFGENEFQESEEEMEAPPYEQYINETQFTEDQESLLEEEQISPDEKEDTKELEEFEQD